MQDDFTLELGATPTQSGGFPKPEGEYKAPPGKLTSKFDTSKAQFLVTCVDRLRRFSYQDRPVLFVSSIDFRTRIAPCYSCPPSIFVPGSPHVIRVIKVEAP